MYGFVVVTVIVDSIIIAWSLSHNWNKVQLNLHRATKAILLKCRPLHFASFLPWIFQLVSEWKPASLDSLYDPSGQSHPLPWPQHLHWSPFTPIPPCAQASLLFFMCPRKICCSLWSVYVCPLLLFPWIWEAMSLSYFRSAGMLPWDSALLTDEYSWFTVLC